VIADRRVHDLGPDHTGEVSDVIATVFADLSIAQYLVPESRDDRVRCLRAQFGLQIEHVHTLGGRVQGIRAGGRLIAVAVWLPALAAGTPPDPPGYDGRLREITGEHYPRFRTLDETFAAHAPDQPHTHLLFAAATVRGQGLGSRLLRHYLAEHDTQPGPMVYLEASSPAAARLYRRHGFTGHPPVEIPGSDGVCLYPMRRAPRTVQAPPSSSEEVIAMPFGDREF
jgi:GNAT superfamily N-acetyltransferase